MAHYLRLVSLSAKLGHFIRTSGYLPTVLKVQLILLHHFQDVRMSPSVSGLRKRDSGHSNDRFYEEMDYDRRLKKRQARLITATEESFEHIRRLNEERMKGENTFKAHSHQSQGAVTVAEGQIAAGGCEKLEKFLSGNCLSQVAVDSQCSVNKPLASTLEHDFITTLETLRGTNFQ